MKLRYAALSDVGRVRKDNQDSGYAGPHLLAIADGVGGSARGDVASSATVEMIRKLDVPPDAAPPDPGPPDTEDDTTSEHLLGALAGAIHRSHDRIAQLVSEFPEIEGTSSTVTAAVFDGTLLGVGHVGDSRGYLLRDGALAQLTTDHTFVQSLIDEGRITEEEARVHPHRNLILRAVDGVHEPEPDVFTLEMAPGDRLLLCSDGCSGVLDDAALTRLLSEGTPEEAATSLVQGALEAGSSDNVTVVVADVVESSTDGSLEPAAETAPIVVGAAAEAPRRRPLAGRGTRSSDTGELPAVPAVGGRGAGPTELDPEEARYAPRPPRRHAWARRGVMLLVLLVLLALIGIGGYKWSQNQYFVATDDDSVVIFQGVQNDFPGIQLHHVKERSIYVLADLPPYRAQQVRDGITANSLDDARAVIRSLRSDVSCPPSPTPTPTPTKKATKKPGKKKATTSPSAPSPSAGASSTPSTTPSTTPSPSPSPTHTPAVCLTETAP